MVHTFQATHFEYAPQVPELSQAHQGCLQLLAPCHKIHCQDQSVLCYVRGFMILCWDQSWPFTIRCREQWYFLMILVGGKSQIYCFEKLLLTMVTNPHWHVYFHWYPSPLSRKQKSVQQELMCTKLCCLCFIIALAKEECFLYQLTH